MTARLPLAALTLALGVGAAPAQTAFDYGSMTPEERAAFGEAVRAYILENPEVIGEAARLLRDRDRAAEVAAESARVRQYRAALHDTSYAWAGGALDGDVTIVEFSDYRCGFCKRAHPEVKAAVERDGNVRLIVREFPILGPPSVVAGRMAMAAYRLDADLYPALNDALMAHEGQLDEIAAYRIADRVGYDLAALRELAGSQAIEAELEKTYRLAEVIGVQATPTFIVDDRIVRGAVSADRLLEVIEEVRADG